MAVSPGTLSALLVIEDTDPSPVAFNFTPAGTPRGIIVRITSDGSATDRITSVTYGGVAMARVTTAADTATEPGRVYIYFLGSGIPTGTQSLSIVHTTGSFKDVVINSINAAAGVDTEIADFDIRENNQANPQVTLTPARDAIAYGVIYSGLGSVASLTMLSGMTAERSVAFTFALRFDRQTAASASAFTIGYTAATDDVAYAAASVQEVASATPVAIALTPATAATSAPALTPTRAAASVALTPASLASSAQALTVVPAAFSAALSPAVAATSAQALSPVTLVAIALTPASASAQAQQLTPVVLIPVEIALTPAQANAVAQVLEAVLANPELLPAAINTEAQILVLVLTGTSVALQPASVGVTAIMPGTVQLNDLRGRRPDMRYKSVRRGNRKGAHIAPPWR